jgi:glycosyltransferase involved in cell wall biosynthesis
VVRTNGQSGAELTSGPIRPVILLPVDPRGSKVSGMRTFVEGFVAYAPKDFEPLIVGVTERADEQLGRETAVRVDGQETSFLPLVHVGDPNRRGLVPLAASYAWHLGRQRRAIPLENSLIQVHRPGTELPVLGLSAPKVRFVHLEVTAPGGESKWRRLPGLLDQLESRTLPRMTRIYVVGGALHDAYLARLPSLAGRLRTVYNWYDERLFHVPQPSARARTRAELAIAADDEVILFVGRLEEQKNPRLLLDGVANLIGTRRTVRLVVLGDGTLRHALEERARNLGIDARTQFLGAVPRPRVASAMAASDVLCITSSNEAGPTVGFEALASGLPVVTTPVGEVSRVLAENWNAGIVVAPTAGDVARGLADVLSRPEQSRRAGAAAAAAPYAASAVLAPIYEDHRRILGTE